MGGSTIEQTHVVSQPILTSQRPSICISHPPIITILATLWHYDN